MKNLKNLDFEFFENQIRNSITHAVIMVCVEFQLHFENLKIIDRGLFFSIFEFFLRIFSEEDACTG